MWLCYFLLFFILSIFWNYSHIIMFWGVIRRAINDDGQINPGSNRCLYSGNTHEIVTTSEHWLLDMNPTNEAMHHTYNDNQIKLLAGYEERVVHVILYPKSSTVVTMQGKYLYEKITNRAFTPFSIYSGRRSPAVACWASDHWVASSLVRTHSGESFVINFASLSPASAWPSLA